MRHVARNVFRSVVTRYDVESASIAMTRLLKANAAPAASASALSVCTKARESMTQTLGMMRPAQLRRFGSNAASLRGVSKDTRMSDFQALAHSRRSEDTSRHRPRWMSCHEKAMIIPVLSKGMPRWTAYDTAMALPSRASRAFSERGCSWIPLWRTPLLRLLVSSPSCFRCSTTTTRGGFPGNLCPKSRAMAHPTTPAPTIQTSYVSIWPNPLGPKTVRANKQEDDYVGTHE